jgi:hypothetical protein
MNSVGTFLLGCAGSVIVEIALFGRIYYEEEIRVPERYKRWHFYLWRMLLVLTGGGLAVFYGLQNPLAAINVGAATPAIISAFARQAPHP